MEHKKQWKMLSLCVGIVTTRTIDVLSYLNLKKHQILTCFNRRQTWQVGFTGGSPSSQMSFLFWSRQAFCRVKVSVPTWCCRRRANWKCALFASAAMRVAFLATHALTAWAFTVLKKLISVECAIGLLSNHNLRHLKWQLQTCNNETTNKMDDHPKI